MFNNYLKTALRIIRQSPVYSLINILGLSAGLTCTILIMLYVNREFSFDRFHENIDRLYRLKMTMIMPDQVQDGAITNLVMGPAIEENIPGVSASVRLLDIGGMVTYEGKAFHEIGGFFADSNFFEVFSFELLQGDPAKVLSDLSGGVITRELALKVFGNENPVGQMMSWNQQIDFMVTGVMNDPPDNSQLEFELILPLEQYIRTFKPYLSWDGGFSNYTYLLLEEGKPAGNTRDQQGNGRKTQPAQGKNENAP